MHLRAMLLWSVLESRGHGICGMTGNLTGTGASLNQEHCLKRINLLSDDYTWEDKGHILSWDIWTINPSLIKSPQI